MWEDSNATPKLLHTLALPGMQKCLWLQREWERTLAAANVAVLCKAGPLMPTACCCSAPAPTDTKTGQLQMLPSTEKANLGLANTGKHFLLKGWHRVTAGQGNSKLQGGSWRAEKGSPSAREGVVCLLSLLREKPAALTPH